jgi:hypothetical protein
VLIYVKLIEFEMLSWTLAAANFVLGALAMLPLTLGALRAGLTFS